MNIYLLYRTGTLEPGDHLLAIDDIHLETFSVEEAAHILRQADDIIKLRVKKDETYSGRRLLQELAVFCCFHNKEKQYVMRSSKMSCLSTHLKRAQSML